MPAAPFPGDANYCLAALASPLRYLFAALPFRCAAFSLHWQYLPGLTALTAP